MASRRRFRLSVGIYARNHSSGLPRYWGDFRRFGGRQEPLVPPGQSRATTDPKVAEELYRQRVAAYELGITGRATLGPFASHHLVEKARSARVTDRWLEAVEDHLDAATKFFGADRPLVSIGVADVQRWQHWLAEGHAKERPKKPLRPLGGGFQRHHLNSLSNLYRRAIAEGQVPPGFNPVSAMLDKPSAQAQEARWLEVHEAALLLEAARTYQPKRAYLAYPFAYPLVAAWLLTGGRPREVLGLETADVSFDRETVTFRVLADRRLKNVGSFRTVRLWPQLAEILSEYLATRPPSRLLFPAYVGDREQMMTDPRKLLDAVAIRAGWKAGDIHPKMFRHTYCAARLQTLDHGAPVSPFTVGKEMGHGGDALVKRIYGHLGTVRHRSEFVEYRVEQHEKVLGERLKALRAASAERPAVA